MSLCYKPFRNLFPPFWISKWNCANSEWDLSKEKSNFRMKCGTSRGSERTLQRCTRGPGMEGEPPASWVQSARSAGLGQSQETGLQRACMYVWAQEALEFGLRSRLLHPSIRWHLWPMIMKMTVSVTEELMSRAPAQWAAAPLSSSNSEGGLEFVKLNN